MTKALRPEEHPETHAVFGGGKRTSPRTSPRISGGIHTEWASRRTSSAFEQGSKTRPSDFHDSVVVRLANMCANARDFHRVGKCSVASGILAFSRRAALVSGGAWDLEHPSV